MESFIKLIPIILVVAIAVISTVKLIVISREIKQYESRTKYRKKLWDWFTDAVKDMSYVGENDLETRFTYHNRYDVCIWKETGLASIHVSFGCECILSTFDKAESKLLADRLLESITI